jgi:hypothetical protein
LNRHKLRSFPRQRESSAGSCSRGTSRRECSSGMTQFERTTLSPKGDISGLTHR